MNKKNNNEKHSYILTKETVGMTVLLFCLVLTVILLTHRAVFLSFGGAICTFMYGTFGYASYFVVAALAYIGEILVFERKIKFNPRCTVLIAFTIVMLFMLFHSVTTRDYAMDGYGSYLKQCYTNAAAGYKGYSFGGVLCGLLVYPIAKGTTFIGAYVIFSLLTVVFAVFSFLTMRSLLLGRLVAKTHGTVKNSVSEEEGRTEAHTDKVDNLYTVNENHEIISNARERVPEPNKKPARTRVQSAKQQEAQTDADNDKYSRENLGRRILFQPGEFAAESYRRNMIYNEDSYFNHPVHTDSDYLRSFGNSSPAQPASDGNAENRTPPAETTYTDDYAARVDNAGSGTGAPSYIYGDEPVQNLGDRPLYEEKPEGEVDAYTVDENSAVGFDDDIIDEPQHEEPDIKNDNLYELDDEIDLPPVQPEEEKREEPPAPVRSELPEIKSEEPPKPVRSEPEKPEEKPSGRGSLFDLFSASNPRLSERRIEPDVSALQSQRRDRSRENLFDEDDGGLFGEQPPLNDRGRKPEAVQPERKPEELTLRKPAEPVAPAPVAPNPAPVAKKEEPPKPVEKEKPKHVWKKYVRPSLDLLDDYPENSNLNTAEIEESKQIICETLADYRIDSRISNVVVGPAITRYDVIIEDRTNIKNALKYREAIAMALMKENVNAYLNYSKGAISIEVPNSARSVVGLKTMLASSTFLNAKPNSLTFTLGKNVEGQVVCPDITKMPHLLVAGTTGSGKSICLSTLIVSLLYKYGPEELRFILVDPKQVEFISYDKLPHLMINEIIYDVDKAIKALNWAIKEMERRYQLFKEMTEKGIATKNLTEYNAHLPEGEEKLPKIVVILDEFGDLMLQAKKDIESRIIRLVQKSRACGIHLILATQRPSVDCITGLIKSNLPTRIGFKVNSFDDARCIFDIGGAEKLLGKGDLYFRSAENPDLARIQGCFIDTHEVQRVTDFVKQHNETYFDQSVCDFINTVEEEPSETPMGDADAGDASKVDDTFIKALKFCVTSNQASVSMIQRRFPIGYMKACKIIDWMENMNYITQSEGSKPRKVLLSREEFIQKYGDVDD